MLCWTHFSIRFSKVSTISSRHTMGYLELILIGFALFIVRSRALKCYTCTYQFSGTSRDKECVDSPWNVTQGQKEIDCPYPYCVVFRQALKAKSTIHSFHRGCEMKGRGNTCVHDSYYSTCSYTCDTDLCNGGDGVPVGDQVGQEVIRTRPRVVPPKRRKPYRPPTPKPYEPRYDYSGRRGGTNEEDPMDYGNNIAGEEMGLDGENGVTDIPMKEKTRKNGRRKDRNGKEQNERRKGDCMHPYACDQGKYRPRNSGVSLSSNRFFYLQSLIVLIITYHRQ